jgi:hypothetical protein
MQTGLAAIWRKGRPDLMDEAFLPFHTMIERILDFRDEIVNEEQGIRSYVTAYEIESPIELDIILDDEGRLQIGTTPPVYYVDTSIRPSFHRLRFSAHRSEVADGDE